MEAIIKEEARIMLKNQEMNCFDFVSLGLSCHGMCLIEKAGILKKLLSSEFEVRESIFEEFKNPHLLKAIFFTLVNSNILSFKQGIYSLTTFGRSLAKNIGAILLPFMGYRKLLVQQSEILDNPDLFNESDIDFPVVANASIDFGQQEFDSILFPLLKYMLCSKSKICDLGCGSGDKLRRISNEFGCHGLGIEKDSEVVLDTQNKLPKDSKIEIIEGDILDLIGVWEDIKVVMVNFVYHDFSRDKSISFLNKLSKHFPRMKYLIITDIVSFSEEKPSILPGFDYVHGLQGISPKNYHEMIETFDGSNFSLDQEITIPNMPNTFIWVLKVS